MGVHPDVTLGAGALLLFWRAFCFGGEGGGEAMIRTTSVAFLMFWVYSYY